MNEMATRSIRQAAPSAWPSGAVRLRRIGIIGVGVVGDALRHYFESLGREVRLFDPYKGLGTLAEVNDAELVFLCVPTPYRRWRGYDGRAVEEAVAELRGEKVVVIKSTVLPGTTDALQRRYHQHHFLFNPEFLREASARGDFLRPNRQIVGYTEQSRPLAEEVLRLLPPAPYARVMPAAEAEMAKYMTNTFLALKVIFANEIFDVCAALGVDYDVVREAAAADPRIGPSHLAVFDSGYRGYAGKCLPKDTKALLDLAASLEVPMHTLRIADRVNDALLARPWPTNGRRRARRAALKPAPADEEALAEEEEAA